MNKKKYSLFPLIILHRGGRISFFRKMRSRIQHVIFWNFLPRLRFISYFFWWRVRLTHRIFRRLRWRGFKRRIRYFFKSSSFFFSYILRRYLLFRFACRFLKSRMVNDVLYSGSFLSFGAISGSKNSSNIRNSCIRFNFNRLYSLKIIRFGLYSCFKHCSSFTHPLFNDGKVFMKHLVFFFTNFGQNFVYSSSAVLKYSYLLRRFIIFYIKRLQLLGIFDWAFFSLLLRLVLRLFVSRLEFFYSKFFLKVSLKELHQVLFSCFILIILKCLFVKFVLCGQMRSSTNIPFLLVLSKFISLCFLGKSNEVVKYFYKEIDFIFLVIRKLIDFFYLTHSQSIKKNSFVPGSYPFFYKSEINAFFKFFSVYGNKINFFPFFRQKIKMQIGSINLPVTVKMSSFVSSIKNKRFIFVNLCSKRNGSFFSFFNRKGVLLSKVSSGMFGYSGPKRSTFLAAFDNIKNSAILLSRKLKFSKKFCFFGAKAFLRFCLFKKNRLFKKFKKNRKKLRLVVVHGYDGLIRKLRFRRFRFRGKLSFLRRSLRRRIHKGFFFRKEKLINVLSSAKKKRRFFVSFSKKKKFKRDFFFSSTRRRKHFSFFRSFFCNVILILRNTRRNVCMKGALYGLRSARYRIIRVLRFIKRPHNGCRGYKVRRL